MEFDDFPARLRERIASQKGPASIAVHAFLDLARETFEGASSLHPDDDQVRIHSGGSANEQWLELLREVGVYDDKDEWLGIAFFRLALRFDPSCEEPFEVEINTDGEEPETVDEVERQIAKHPELRELLARSARAVETYVDGDVNAFEK